MSDRELVMGRIRAALAARAERAPAPEYDDGVAVASGSADRRLVELFAERLSAARGRLFRSPGELAGWLRQEHALAGYCDPELAELVRDALSGFSLESEFVRARIDEYRFGITRAVGAIAETGTVILDDATTSNRLAALAPWIHVAVLRHEDLYPDLAAALRTLGGDPNVVWVTGPSKTADVEGILIEGVHGPGEQAVLLV